MDNCFEQICQCKSCTLRDKFCYRCNECNEHKVLNPVEDCIKIYNSNIAVDKIEENIRSLIKHFGNEEQVCLLYEKAKIEYKLNKTEFSTSYGKIYSMVMDYMFPR